MYILNYFQAGSNMKSFSYSSGIGWASFQDKIDFNYIRELGKKMIKRTIQDNNPCLNDLRVYFSIIKIENDEDYLKSLEKLTFDKVTFEKRESSKRIEFQVDYFKWWHWDE